MLWIALTFSMNIEHIVPWQRCSRRNALFQSHSHFPHLQFGIRVRVSWKTFAMTVEQIVKKLRKENKNSNITKKNTIGIAWETAQSGGNSQFYFPFRFLSFRFTSDYSRCFFFRFGWISSLLICPSSKHCWWLSQRSLHCLRFDSAIFKL